MLAVAAALALVTAHASLTIDPNDVGFATPKVAAVDYSTDSSATNQAFVARFPFAIIGARVGTTLQSFTNGIHAINPSTQMAAYTVPTELVCNQPPSTDYSYALWNHTQSTDWWLRKADGTRSQWTTSYGACDINLTAWAKRDGSGYTWQQYKAQYDHDHSFSLAPNVAYVFSDNAWAKPRVDADFKRIGTNQLRTESDIVTAQRVGQVAFWDAIKSHGRKVIGNADNDLTSTEFAGQLHGAFFEGAMGKSWSIETWSSWEAMRDQYQSMIDNTSEHLVFLQVYGSPTDYQMMRYGLCSALMVDGGYYVYLPSSGTLKSAWYDEYEAPIGVPLYAAPTAPYPVAQGGDGIYWRRTYSNGLVLVNPSKTQTAHATIPAGYKRLQGTQDPTVNNGQVVTSVTLPPRSGLLLIKN